MLLKAEVPLEADETGGSLHDKLSTLGGELLIETLKGLEAGTIQPEKQDDSQAGEYARMLGVTPNYLNVLSQRCVGVSALSLIHRRIMLEIKRLLLRTDLDVSEIAYAMRFNELSYFSRFFKRNAGVTPNEFRRSMNKMYQK